jgi:annexin A7/11
MKGFGTDEKALINVLAYRDPLQVVAIRDAYTRIHHRTLELDIKEETSGYFERGLVSLLRGPLLHDVKLLHEAMDGPGTKESVLNNVLLGRSNADLRAIKDEYHRTFHRDLVQVVRGDLSFKTERHFDIVLQANRAEDAVPVNKPDIDRDVSDLYNATEGKVGTDEIKVCSILSLRNDNQIRAIAYEYRQRYARDLEEVIKRVKPFVPHVSSIPTLTAFRSSLVIWRPPCFSSFGTRQTSTCTKLSFWRTPWLAWAQRTSCWLPRSSGRIGTARTSRM